MTQLGPAPLLVPRGELLAAELEANASAPSDRAVSSGNLARVIFAVSMTSWSFSRSFSATRVASLHQLLAEKYGCAFSFHK